MPIHIRAQKGEIAPCVLLPGNPERTKFIAENFLEGARQYTSYRLMYGYTGTYQGIPISVQTTGMGAPSAAIILEELIMLGAEHFLRMGTCGDLRGDLTPGQLVVPTSASALNGTTRELSLIDGYAPTADFAIVEGLLRNARAKSLKAVAGPIGSMDLFYHPDPEINQKCRAMGLLALEMEAPVTFTMAALHKKRAAALLTVSDNIPTGVRADPGIIELGVKAMTQVALDTAVMLHDTTAP